jgi:hypothetical protein
MTSAHRIVSVQHRGWLHKKPFSHHSTALPARWKRRCVP